MSDETMDRTVPAQHAGGEQDPVSSDALNREGGEPGENLTSPPSWAWVVVFGILLFCVFYQGKYGGTISFETHALWRVKTAGGGPAGPPNGATIYATRCASCHQAKGEGLPGMYPPLAGGELAIGDAGRAIRILMNGLQGPVTVKGTVYNGAMPAWGPQLTNEEIAAVLTHVRSSWGNAAAPVDAAAVDAIRKEFGTRTEAWTAAELEKVVPAPAVVAKK